MEFLESPLKIILHLGKLCEAMFKAWRIANTYASFGSLQLTEPGMIKESPLDISLGVDRSTYFYQP